MKNKLRKRIIEIIRDYDSTMEAVEDMADAILAAFLEALPRRKGK